MAVTLHKLLENKLRASGLLSKITVNKAFDLARKVKVTVFADGTRIPCEVPRKARNILESIAPGLLESFTAPKDSLTSSSDSL
ncbi:MAG: hypothetical protein PHV82_17575 [Victivallaceae bacterium]|nr:hypothetical protein [Victivallaceae bacterium]